MLNFFFFSITFILHLHRILHYGNHYDVQTAAMLACIFHVKSNENQKRKANEAGLGGNISVSLNGLTTLLLFLSILV